MSYDLNILVKEQKEVSSFAEKKIKIINEKEQILRYKEIWRYMSNAKGIWYTLGTDTDCGYNAMELIDADFDIDISLKKNYGLSLAHRETILHPIILNNKYEQELCTLIREFIQKSPIKTIIFLARYQGEDIEIVYGVISVNEFIEMLCKRKLTFNVSYIVCEST
jgi:hypothetical protein